MSTDRVPKHKQRLANENAETDINFTENKSPAETDKKDLSPQQAENASKVAADQEKSSRKKPDKPAVKE